MKGARGDEIKAKGQIINDKVQRAEGRKALRGGGRTDRSDGTDRLAKGQVQTQKCGAESKGEGRRAEIGATLGSRG